MGFFKKIAKRQEWEARKQTRKDGKRVKKAAVRDYYQEEKAGKDELFKMQVIILMAVRELYGMGAKRLMYLIDRVKLTSDCISESYLTHVSFPSIEKQLEKETGYWIESQRIKSFLYLPRQHDAIDQVSLLYLWALHLQFDFGKKRLSETYRHCTKIYLKVMDGERTIDGMIEALEKTGMPPLHMKGYND